MSKTDALSATIARVSSSVFLFLRNVVILCSSITTRCDSFSVELRGAVVDCLRASRQCVVLKSKRWRRDGEFLFLLLTFGITVRLWGG